MYGIALMTCLSGAKSVCERDLLRPDAHSSSSPSLLCPPDAGVEPPSAQDVQLKASCLSGLRQWSSTLYGETGKKTKQNRKDKNYN